VIQRGDWVMQKMVIVFRMANAQFTFHGHALDINAIISADLRDIF
jgi:hypothetical protein